MEPTMLVGVAAALVVIFSIFLLRWAWTRLRETEGKLKAAQDVDAQLRTRLAEAEAGRGRGEIEQAQLAQELLRLRDVMEAERAAGAEARVQLEVERADKLARLRELEAAERRAAEHLAQSRAVADEGERLREALGEAASRKAAVDQRVEALEERAQELTQAQQRIEELHERLRRAGEENRELATRSEEQAKAVSERMRMQEELHLQQKQEFEGIAAKVLEQNTSKFSGTAKLQLGELAVALSKELAELKKRVEEVHNVDVRDRVALRSELQQVVAANVQLDADAKKLTRALTADKRAQGAWGELALETLLEHSGLREGHEYTRQPSFRNEDERAQRPDVIVNLPGGRSVVVDSKVSLTAYTEHVSADSDDAVAGALTRHVESVRTHVKVLSGKEYWKLQGLNAGDYVLMFVPVEGAFADALRAAPSLFGEAMEKAVVLVSPCTLLATLRTIENSWRVERKNDMADQVLKHATTLYEKFVGFAADMTDVGKELASAQKAYDGAMNKLQMGRGNLLGRVERLRELGIKTNKVLPAALQSEDMTMPMAKGEA